MSSSLEDVFELLEIGTRLEKSGTNRVEAATKYYEAVHLMEQILQHTPQTAQSSATRSLLREKISFYSAAASRLYFDDTSTVQLHQNQVHPKSPAFGRRKESRDDVPSLTKHHPPPPAGTPRLTQTAAFNRMAGKANSTLALAIELDEKGKTKEALAKYMGAAELYLQTMQSGNSNDSSIMDVLKRRLEGAMDRVEQLKRNGRSSMNDNRLTRSNDQNQNRDMATNYTKAEIAVLKRSSLIASGLFLPWSDAEASALSRHAMKLSGTPKALFTDPDGVLPLSSKQQLKFHRWARPSEIVQQRKQWGSKQHPPVMIRSVNPYSIRQQYVTDCSFVASLCICAAFEKRFRKRLITSIVFPQDEKGIPIYNPEGKYMVKLWLNGVTRQVIVDDRLPIDRHSNLLCSNTKSATKDHLELWVSIIEKAYMKLCGGYDFPGSNSGIDLFSLTGWLPERIFFPQDPNKLRDFETEPDRAWERLFSANSFGDCLITVATSRDISEADAEALGLVTGHAYAVLDVVETKNGTQLLQLKNPWASKSWRGKYSCYDTSSWRDKSLSSEIGYDPIVAAQHDDGIFWISWVDVLRYFHNVQLSWNPELFPYRVTTHGFWPINQGPVNDTFNIGENPQYIMAMSKQALKKKASIWILISRHVTKQEQEGAEVDDFLTVHLIRNTAEKERMWYPHGPKTLVNGAYTNNSNVLVRYDIESDKDEYISLVLSQYQKRQDMGYTLFCLCTEPFTLTKPPPELPYPKEINGSWNQATAGGPIGQDDFFNNPSYLVEVGEETSMQLRCSTVKTYAVNVMLIEVPSAITKSEDPRRFTILKGKPYLDSGNYRHGFVVTKRKTVKAGTYVLVVSTFHRGQLGVFQLKVTSSKKVALRTLT